MKAITSNLELLNFVVIESSLSLIQPNTDEFNHEVFKKYDLEIDFSKSKSLQPITRRYCLWCILMDR